MNAISFRRFLLFSGISVVGLLALGALWFFISLQKDPPKSLTKLAKPLIKLDLQAPQEHGWLSDHEIFFLREKNQGDFLCVKTDIRDGTETVIEELSPYLQDMENRSVLFRMFPSPSGKRLAIHYGVSTNGTRFLHDFETSETFEFKKIRETPHYHSWLPDESGWISWKPKKLDNSRQTEYSLKPFLFSKEKENLKIEDLVVPFLPFPPFIFKNSTNLTMAQLSNNADSGEEDILMNLVSLEKTRTELSSSAHLMVRNALLTSNLDFTTSQNGDLWLIAHEQYSPVWKVRRTQTFPYFRFDTSQLKIEMWNFGSKRSTTLDPDITFKNPRQFKLNPSGTHFSFIFQGQIWVTEIADFLK